MRTVPDILHLVRIMLLTVGLVALGLTGCGGPKMPKTYPLKGKVIYKGGKPVTGGSLAFEATTAEGRWHGSAAIGPDGTFTEVATVRPDNQPAQGLVEGEHRVRIDLGRGGDPAERGPRLRVPARYVDFDKSGLRVKVPAPNNEVIIELEP